MVPVMVKIFNLRFIIKGIKSNSLPPNVQKQQQQQQPRLCTDQLLQRNMFRYFGSINSVGNTFNTNVSNGVGSQFSNLLSLIL